MQLHVVENNLECSFFSEFKCFHLSSVTAIYNMLCRFRRLKAAGAFITFVCDWSKRASHRFVPPMSKTCLLAKT